MDRKYINVFAYADGDTAYWTVDEVKEMKRFFESRTIIWNSGLDIPNVAEKAAYRIFKRAMERV